MKRQQAAQLFSEAHRLHRIGHSHRAIGAILGVSRVTIIKWLAQPRYGDQRGWQPGRPRKHTDSQVVDRICGIKKDLVDHNYFFGNAYVQMVYHKCYPQDPRPSLWYIDDVVRRAGLQGRKPKTKQRGGSVYQLYPKESLEHLGLIHQAGDFIGKKYLEGSSSPVTVFSSCYYRPFKLYHIQRTDGEKAILAMGILAHQWADYPIPDVFRFDNGGPFRGTGHLPRRLGTFVVFLLNLGITPLFSSPSKPWTNGAMEGHNRVFTDKIWRKHRFQNHHQIDVEIDRFNGESTEFCLYRYPTLIKRYRNRCLKVTPSTFSTHLRTRRNKKIAFVRFVQPTLDERKDHITIMNEAVYLPERYSNQFVFALWDLQHEDLTILSEYDGRTHQVKRIPFKIND